MKKIVSWVISLFLVLIVSSCSIDWNDYLKNKIQNLEGSSKESSIELEYAHKTFVVEALKYASSELETENLRKVIKKQISDEYASCIDKADITLAIAHNSDCYQRILWDKCYLWYSQEQEYDTTKEKIHNGCWDFRDKRNTEVDWITHLTDVTMQTWYLEIINSTYKQWFWSGKQIPTQEQLNSVWM